MTEDEREQQLEHVLRAAFDAIKQEFVDIDCALIVIGITPEGALEMGSNLTDKRLRLWVLRSLVESMEDELTGGS